MNLNYKLLNENWLSKYQDFLNKEKKYNDYIEALDINYYIYP